MSRPPKIAMERKEPPLPTWIIASFVIALALYAVWYIWLFIEVTT